MIPHNRPTIGNDEQAAANRVLASGWVAQGPEVKAFEDEICAFLGLDPGHAVAVSSGTAALFLALWALDAFDKQVALPVYSCAALRNAVIMAGGKPLVIDVASNSPNIDMDQAIQRKADIVIAAHLFGMPSEWDRDRVHVPVIEDCAQALGARLHGRPAGINGTIGIFSFYATKMITSGGQGGMVVSHNQTLIDAVRDYREFDCRHDRKPRFNLQMTDLQAAIGRVQLALLPSFIERRRNAAQRYAAAGLRLWPGHTPGAESCHYRAIIRQHKPLETIAKLELAGIRAIIPVESWELLGEPHNFPRAAQLTTTTVSLPIYPSLRDAEIDRITETVLKLA